MNVTISLILAILAVVFLALSIFTQLPLWICVGFLCGAVIFGNIKLS